MFLFASKDPLHTNNDCEVNTRLRSRINGYLVNSLLQSSADFIAKQQEYLAEKRRCEILDEQAEKRLADIETLTTLINKSKDELKEMDRRREYADRQLAQTQRQLEKSWEAILVSSSNLESISTQFQIMCEHAEQRLADVNTLHRIITDMQSELDAKTRELDTKTQEYATLAGTFLVRMLRKLNLI
jgi:chromosome segregation ATPase